MTWLKFPRVTLDLESNTPVIISSKKGSEKQLKVRKHISTVVLNIHVKSIGLKYINKQSLRKRGVGTAIQSVPNEKALKDANRNCEIVISEVN